VGDLVRRWLVALTAVAALAGCGEESTDEGEELEEPEPVEPEEVGGGEAAPTSGYSIHEWGLIDVDLSESRVEYAAGPGTAEADDGEDGPTPTASTGGTGDSTTTRRRRIDAQGREVVDRAFDTADNVLDTLTGRRARRRKPVLYFHLDAPAPAFTFDLTVSLGSTARVVEHFPAGDLTDHGVGWTQIGLAQESCPGGPYPAADSEVCEGVADGYCEAAELAGYVSDDAGCITVGGVQQNFLFYRGDGPAPDLPLTIARGADGTITVTNATMVTPVGQLLRLRRDGDTIRVSQAAIPTQGQSVQVPVPAASATDAHREVIRAQLVTIGLTEGERRAFETAWFGELFDASADTPHAFVDAVLFFLPPAQVDGFAHIEATPAPSTTVRAMAVRAGWSQL